MNIPHKLKARRAELKLSPKDLGEKVGLSLSEYLDIEAHDDELQTVPDLNTVKKLCAELQMDLLELLDIQCIYCSGTRIMAPALPRNDLVKRRRSELKVSQGELGDRLGWDAIVIGRIETNPDHLESWSLDNINDLAKELKVPIQMLLGVKCKEGH